MKLKLGDSYVTGGPNGQKTLTLPFWNEDSRGEPFRYVHIPLKWDLTDDEVVAVLNKAAGEVAKLKSASDPSQG